MWAFLGGAAGFVGEAGLFDVSDPLVVMCLLSVEEYKNTEE
jgi:hypothetical protein